MFLCEEISIKVKCLLPECSSGDNPPLSSVRYTTSSVRISGFIKPETGFLVYLWRSDTTLFLGVNVKVMLNADITNHDSFFLLTFVL